MLQAMFSWRGLAVCWAGAIIIAGLGAGVLQALGPLPPTEKKEAGPASAPQDAHPEEEPSPKPATPPPEIAAPNPALLEPSPTNPSVRLPRVGENGLTARVAYAAPVVKVPAGTPLVAILISGFGLSERDSQQALTMLPGPVSFAVSAYSSVPPSTVDAARLAGHELLASVPMEPQGYPLTDEGDRSLLTGLTPSENHHNLNFALGRTEGAVGATGASDGMRGERFAAVSAAINPILHEIGRRGLLYVDPVPGSSAARPGLAARSVDMVIDDPPARADIEAKLATLERTAREKGSAIGLAGPLYPNTIDRIADWAKGLKDRGIALAPVSQLVTAPAEPAEEQAK